MRPLKFRNFYKLVSVLGQGAFGLVIRVSRREPLIEVDETDNNDRDTSQMQEKGSFGDSRISAAADPNPCSHIREMALKVIIIC